MEKAKKHSKGGRPTKYKDEYAKQALKLCLLGATDKELAEFFDVDPDTVYEWKKIHTEFSESIKKGKIEADANISSKLYHRALGYNHPDVHISNYKGDITTTKITKHYPPDTTAAIFWLKNRQPTMWRDKQEVAISQESQITKIEVEEI